ncbi:MAG TPA: endolytic transglycosylase MltG [Ferruginibacter sp.]|nr:endolytic transglycosylase MltG [Ferruginibacter sp.]
MKKKIAVAILFIILLTGSYVAWQIFAPTITAPKGKYFYIKTGTVYADVKQNLLDEKIIHNSFFFDLLAKRIKYPTKVKAGRYKLNPGMSLFKLLRMLRSGKQAPVNLVITKLRTTEDLAQKIAANFECDSATFMKALNDSQTWQQFNVDSNTIITSVIPNTYSFYWNTPASKILKKLHDEKIKFWTTERLAKTKVLGLTPNQVYSMASIVEEETNKEEDKGKIASVYINRIAAGMKLQADPTVKFAMKDFKLTRILHGHLTYPSPFNTYVNTGLPPGPICTPSVKTIDAVLNAPQTNYLYFVAKPTFDGYSNFASTYAEHQVFAKAYQQALDSLIKARANK